MNNLYRIIQSDFLNNDEFNIISSLSRSYFRLCNNVKLCKFDIININEIKYYHEEILLVLKWTHYLNNIQIINELQKKHKIYFDIQYDSNEEIIENTLPNTLIHILFTYESKYKNKFKKSIFPDSLTKLILDRYSEFNYRIEQNDIPPFLTHLNLGGSYNKPIDKYVLPNTLTTLIFGWGFNQEINENI